MHHIDNNQGYVLDETEVSCPYCGELIQLLIDCSTDQQEYIEDCQVCCRPIQLKLQVSHDGHYKLQVSDENT